MCTLLLPQCCCLLLPQCYDYIQHISTNVVYIHVHVNVSFPLPDHAFLPVFMRFAHMHPCIDRLMFSFITYPYTTGLLLCFSCLWFFCTHLNCWCTHGPLRPFVSTLSGANNNVRFVCVRFTQK